MSCIGKKTLAVFTLLLVGTANAAFTLPAEPDWWTIPPPGATRLQHHSFHADPNLNMMPDYTHETYTPSIPDQWTVPANIQYNVTLPMEEYWPFLWPGRPALNDGIGANLSLPGTLTKHMGNLRVDENIKEFYALVIWRGAGALSISVSSEADTTITSTPWGGGEAGWTATILQGTIDPQPDWEDFTFAFTGTGTVFLDEVYVGTHCIPEPASLLLLGLGGLALTRRR